jgi:signal peptidase I
MTQQATPPMAPTSASPARSPAPKESSVKETLESILVAFILAFIFRAFVVEAFVIPTGSMAPTLLGAHMRYRCQDCGYRFDANYTPAASANDELYIPQQSDKSYRVFCPNCGYKIPLNDIAEPENDSFHPDVHYGDRILVLKYLYLLQDPQRWDVVVFKSPDVRRPDDSGYNANASTYQQNYIKRLIGRPNESVMILDGDIYIGKPGDDVPAYTVQPKPRYVQGALWRVVYDNDFVPQRMMRSDGTKWQQPWTVRDGDGWNLGDPAKNDSRIFRFNNTSGQATLFFDRNANPIADRPQDPMPYALSDWLAYDVETAGQRNPVHDLKLSFIYNRTAGDGPLRAKLSSGDHQFIAEISPTQARLLHVSKAGEEPVGQPFALPKGKSPVRVEFSNVDYQVTLRINDKDIAQTTPQQYRPDVNALLQDFKLNRPRPYPEIEVTAANQTAELSHIGVWRDIYYINQQTPGQASAFWGTPNKIMNLGPDEYFVLGDNSLISGDARYWNVPIELPWDQLEVLSGRVPGRFMLGRAFFVYWPAGFRPASKLPGVIPNFGDMRFIR